MRYVIEHQFDPGTTRSQFDECEKKLTSDPDIRHHHSFVNLSEGRAMCTFDAPDREKLERWLDENNMSYQSIWAVELEGEHGEFIEIPTVVETGAGG